MISFLTGVPGSGKSYYAVDKIYNNFSTDKEAIKDKKATYENCYTNINEFKFDRLENCFYLDFEDLKKKLTELHKLYKAKNSDDVLIEYCKENGILNTLFVIDEAHNYFDAKDTVLIWWLSYHRHLFHEIILITQNLSLIESKYKSFSEFFYKAFPQSLTFIKTHFKYNVYCSSRMSHASKSGSFKIKRNPKVFELYQSGDSINSTNILLKFFILGLVFLAFASAMLYYYISSRSSASIDNNQSSQIVESNQDPIQNNVNAAENKNNNVVYLGENTEIYNEAKFLTLSCNTSICYNDTISLPVPLVTYFIKSKSLNLLYSQNINKNYVKLFASCSESFYSFLYSNSIKGSDKDEKSTIGGFFNTASVPVSQGR